MNCKQGDLAVVVHGAAVGYVVRCVRRYDGPWAGGAEGKGWEIDRCVPATDGTLRKYKGDFCLRPIRDTDGEDETLTWKAVPKAREAA